MLIFVFWSPGVSEFIQAKEEEERSMNNEGRGVGQ